MLQHTLYGILFALLTTLPLAWKWQLGVRRVGLVVVSLAIVSGALVLLIDSFASIGLAPRIALVWGLTMVAGFAGLACLFFRDPERMPPDRDDVILSPADGEVIYVRRFPGGTVPVATKNGRSSSLEELTKTPLRTDEAVVVGIGMSFTDVHVNRAAIGGKVTLRRHFPGLFGSLRHPEMVFANERTTTVIERDGLQIAMVQIASRLVRRIVPFVSEGDDVALGQRIGVIRFGSQVDLVLPARDDLKVTVEPGERVRAGESIVAILESPGDSPSHDA